MDLNCNFESMLFSGVTRYACVIDTAMITKPGININSIIGNHEELSNNECVEVVYFHDTVIEYLPRGFSKIFPNLKGLEVSRCNLKSLVFEDLKGLENLEMIYIRYNETLNSLPSDLFIGMRALREISFEGNNLCTVSSEIFKPLKKNKLTIVNFEDNSKINAYYQPNKPSSSAASVDSLQKLLDLIDKNCETPSDQNHQSYIQEFATGTASFWKSEQFSDFTITVGNSQKFKVHKIVLAAQSTVFAAAFTIDMKESLHSTMDIDDFEADVVGAMLEFMYTCKIQHKTDPIQLFMIAARFQIQSLMKMAEKLVLLNIEDTTAFQVFHLGHLHSVQSFKLVSFNIIKEIFPKITISLLEKPKSLEVISGNYRKILEAHSEINEEINKYQN